MNKSTPIDGPNIDDKIREMLFSWHKWRDYYYSDLKEQVITDDEWKVTRDKIDDDAIKAIKAFIANQVREELTNLKIARLNLGTMTTDHADGYQMAVDDMNRHIDELRAVIGQDNE